MTFSRQCDSLKIEAHKGGIFLLTVLATGKGTLAPDTIQMNFTLNALQPEYNEAVDAASLQLSQLHACLEDVGFSKQELVTTDFYINTQYEHVKDEVGNYKQVFRGYSVRHSLKLLMPFNMMQLSSVVGAISICRANPELNLQFIIKNTQELKELALQDASKKAQRQAQVLADSLQVNLESIKEINMLKDYPEIQPRSYQPDYLVAESSYMDITPEDVQTEVTISVTYHTR